MCRVECNHFEVYPFNEVPSAASESPRDRQQATCTLERTETTAASSSNQEIDRVDRFDPSDSGKGFLLGVQLFTHIAELVVVGRELRVLPKHISHMPLFAVR